MEFWTVLWIAVLGTQVDGSTSGLLYPSLAECEAAINTVAGTLPYDYSVMCEETGTMSRVVRPVPRPADLMEGR